VNKTYITIPFAVSAFDRWNRSGSNAKIRVRLRRRWMRPNPKKRFSDARIAFAPRHAKAGATVEEFSTDSAGIILFWLGYGIGRALDDWCDPSIVRCEWRYGRL